MMYIRLIRPTADAVLRAILPCAVLLLANVSALSADLAGPPAIPADLVLTGGKVRVGDGWAQALAIRSGVIVAVGNDAEALAERGPRTHVIDLHGDTVLPGIHDSHVHPLDGGMTERQCKVPQGSTLAATLSIIKGCVARSRPGEWVLGGQWDAPALGGIPNRRQLDGVAPSVPVMINDTSGHSAWVNSLALAEAGITRHTPNPEGGIIERDALGEPTGILRDNAVTLLGSHIPKATQAALQSALRWALDEMLSVGITSFTEAAVGFVAGPEEELRAYDALADAGAIKQRVTLCITWAPGNAEAERAIRNRNLYSRTRLQPDCVKIFLDGVPTDSHTAAMLEPYSGMVAGRDDDAARYGLLLVKQEVLDEAVTRFDAMGLTVKFHAAGDAAVRAGIHAIAAARAAHGYSGLMHNVGHCTFVATEDLAKARAVGAVLEVSPYLWGPTPINDAIAAAVSHDVIRRVWPVREMIDAGNLVVAGSDWSVVPSVNPWIGIEELVTREAPGGSAKSFGKTEAITLPEAFDLFTVNAARQARRSDLEGRIETGMLADIIVVDRNPFEIPVTQIHDIHVLSTFVAGELVYERRAQPEHP